MPAVRSNALLPVIGGIIVLMALFVLVKTLSGDDGGDEAVLTEVPRPAAPDGDTPAETIRTLTANVASLTNQTEALRRDNESLQAANERLLSERRMIEQTIERKVRQNIEASSAQLRAQARESNSILSSLTQRIDALSSTVQNYMPDPGREEIPAGLGLDGVNAGPGMIWHDPLDAPAATPGAAARNGGLLRKTRDTTQARRQTSAGRPQTHTPPGRPAQEEASVTPVYTIPKNATLTGATAFTALVGRIPVGDRVQDPWPFKVITGPDNLTANGLKLPDVAGMVWSGLAVGDWTLGCVRGWVTSATFIFRDGTVRTVNSRSDDGQATNMNAITGDGIVSGRALGWISDRFGTPCVGGRRITNAPQYLSQRVALLSAQAAAEAAAAAQTSTVVSGSTGTITQAVKGSDEYIIGKTVSGGINEISQWLEERQQQSFDAVLVRAGAEIAINVTKELEIDYDPNGRKLRYANDTGNTRLPWLD
ncbi:MAG TPA: TIGR03752 family integrating conjugative element protein [Thiotrichales bacterium]|nr:TIGR03752 family integrating conjugative element protein [Thiotrichales bacterium]